MSSVDLIEATTKARIFFKYIHHPLVGTGYVLHHVFCEVMSAEWTFSLHLKPIHAALLMEVVFGIARQDQDVLICLEGNEANDAVGHLVIFVLILSIIY